MRNLLLLLVAIFVALPLCLYAGMAPRTDIVQLTQTDLAATQISAYYDLRQRKSYVQVTNVTSDTVNIHVQIFQQDRGCSELNFDDTLTANDTIVYDLENMVRNNGTQIPINLQDDSYGYVVVTDTIVDEQTTPTPSLIGNFRIVDDAEYEYRTNMPGSTPLTGTSIPGPTDLDEITFQAFFNTVDNAQYADVVGYLFQNNTSSTVTNFDAGIDFDIFVFDLDEEPLSCDRRNFACGAVMNYGVNEDYVSSKGNPPVCPGGGIAGGIQEVTSKALPNGLNGGYVNFENGALGAAVQTNNLPVFVYLMGINNNNGTGSMDTWIDPTVVPSIDPPLVEECRMMGEGCTEDEDCCDEYVCAQRQGPSCVDPCDSIICREGTECVASNHMAQCECELTEDICIDDDGDTEFGCSDSDCNGFRPDAETCAVCEMGEELTCDDGFDNDTDSEVDCNDEDCCSNEVCIPIPNSSIRGECGIEVCDDFFDNDGDGLEDCNDDDCCGDEACGPIPNSSIPDSCGLEVCDDEFDNDGDGQEDCDDTDCQSGGNSDGGDICFEVTCDDGQDNETTGSQQNDGADCLDTDCDGLDCIGGFCSGFTCIQD